MKVFLIALTVVALSLSPLCLFLAGAPVASVCLAGGTVALFLFTREVR